MDELEKLDSFSRKRIDSLIEKSNALNKEREKLNIQMIRIAKQHNIVFRQIEQFWTHVRSSKK